LTGRRDDAHGRDLAPVLGRTLAETQLLNSPAQRASEAARAALRRSHAPDRARLEWQRRAFRRAVLILIVAVAAVGGLAWLLET
jgi:hypothetical protein